MYGLVTGILLCALSGILPTPLNIICGVEGAAFIVYDGLMAICDKLE